MNLPEQPLQKHIIIKSNDKKNTFGIRKILTLTLLIILIFCSLCTGIIFLILRDELEIQKKIQQAREVNSMLVDSAQEFSEGIERLRTLDLSDNDQLIEFIEDIQSNIEPVSQNFKLLQEKSKDLKQYKKIQNFSRSLENYLDKFDKLLDSINDYLRNLELFSENEVNFDDLLRQVDKIVDISEELDNLEEKVVTEYNKLPSLYRINR